ncbi:efflux RND transporter periplasmic adaptor subunit [Chloroflexota bacterium]
MKIWRILIILLLSLVLTGATACEAIGGGEEVAVQEVEVVRGDLLVSISGSGSIDISEEADLTFGLGGNIDRIYVEEDDEVAQGDVLARLDTGALELALVDAQSNLALAVAAQAQAVATYELAKATLDAAEYDLYILTKRHVSYEQQRITKLQISAAQLQLDASQLQLDATQLQLAAAERAIPEVEKQLQWAVITAPFAGTISSLDVDEGDTVLATQMIMQLIDLTSLELDAEVDEIDVAEVKPGQRAIIEVDALPALQLEGEVMSISLLPEVEAGVVLYKVKIAFNVSPDLGLRVGMSATADIVITERNNVLLVPDRAIRNDSQGNPIVEIMVGEQIEERAVVVGITDGFETEIIDGLDEGEVVLRRSS